MDQWVSGSRESTNTDNHVGGPSCEPLTHDPLTDDEVNRIVRKITITFGIRPMKLDVLL